MPQLIRDVQAEIIETSDGSVQYITLITGLAQEEDYVEVYGLIAYLQDLTKTDVVIDLIKPVNFGLANERNIKMITLEIDY